MRRRSTLTMRRRRRAGKGRIGCLLALASLALAGCSADDIDKTYGRRRGSEGGASVNGVGVLAGMFEQQGHRVATARRLSPKLDRYDTIIWAPDDFEPPGREQREFLEDWLRAEGFGNRTLVYIGRDYDAATTYWRNVRRKAPALQAEEIARRLAKAQSEHDRARVGTSEKGYTRWFVARRDGARRAVRQLSSPDDTWTDGIDASKVGIEIEGALDVPQPLDKPQGERELPAFEVLLQSGDDAIVMRVRDDYWESSKIIVATNGSFLLNLPLVNHEHRKLAGKLIAECGPPGSTVFLESGPGGPPVANKDPKTRYPTVLDVLRVWPLSVVMLHFVALGLLFCFAYFPVFGEPRKLERDATSDFGKHVDALGDLLQRTRDQAYAAGRLKHYQQNVQRDSGASRAQRASDFFTTGKS